MDTVQTRMFLGVQHHFTPSFSPPCCNESLLGSWDPGCAASNPPVCHRLCHLRRTPNVGFLPGDQSTWVSPSRLLSRNTTGCVSQKLQSSPCTAWRLGSVRPRSQQTLLGMAPLPHCHLGEGWGQRALCTSLLRTLMPVSWPGHLRGHRHSAHSSTQLSRLSGGTAVAMHVSH